MCLELKVQIARQTLKNACIDFLANTLAHELPIEITWGKFNWEILEVKIKEGDYPATNRMSRNFLQQDLGLYMSSICNHITQVIKFCFDNELFCESREDMIIFKKYI